MTAPDGPQPPAPRDVYAGLAGMSVEVVDGAVVLNLSTPDRPHYARLRLDPEIAQSLGLALLDAAEDLPS